MKVRIEDRNDDGRGRGTVDGRTALLSQAHPGEFVTLRVDKVTKGTIQGRVGQVIEPDPKRIRHSCEHVFRCTGCPLLAAAPDDEAEFKRDRIVSALGDFVPASGIELPVQPSELFGWRHWAKGVFGKRKGQAFLGSYVAGTHHVEDNRSCPILTPDLRALFDRVSDRITENGLDVHDPRKENVGFRFAMARQSRANGDMLLGLSTSSETTGTARELCEQLVLEIPNLKGAHVLHNREHGNVMTAGEFVVGSGEMEIEETLLGHSHRIDLRSFFQVNPQAAEVLFAKAVEWAGEGERLLEGYAGVGALTLPLSEKFSQVVAVESHPTSSEALNATAAVLNIENLQVIHEDLENVIEQQLNDFKPEVVVLDPPRKGLSDSVVAALAAAPPQRIVLLSCDPKSLAKDLPKLIEAGFALREITGVDQFPRTAHVETVSLLVHSEAKG